MAGPPDFCPIFYIAKCHHTLLIAHTHRINDRRCQVFDDDKEHASQVQTLSACQQTIDPCYGLERRILARNANDENCVVIKYDHHARAVPLLRLSVSTEQSQTTLDNSNLSELHPSQSISSSSNLESVIPVSPKYLITSRNG